MSFKLDRELIDQTYNDNMSAFKKYLPDIYDCFKDYKEERYFLVYDSFGDYNIYDNKRCENLYNPNPMTVCSGVLKEYEKSPILFSKLLAGAGEAGAKINPIHVSTTVSLASVAMGVQAVSPFTLFPKKIKSMLFVGVGIGHDVEYIINNKDIKNLIILEKDKDIFFASLFIVRWDLILDKYSKDGLNLSIIIDEDSDFLSNQLFDKVRKYGQFMANAMFIYCPASIDGYDELIESLSDVVRGRLLSGFGFYEDARYSIAATYENVKRNVPLYIRNNELHEIVGGISYPIFVIGNGPSLDSDINFIRNNSNKAIIISCGSAIKTLERNGILPDFHVECERTAWTKSWLDQVDQDFIKKVNFIGLNLIYPDVFEMFKRSGMLAKTGETGSYMLARALERLKGEPYLPLHSHVNPTVSHMGVGIAPFLGMRRFYLFGIDMGYKSPDYHHSKDSSYSDLKDNYKEEYSPKEDKSFHVDSNFKQSNMLTNGDYLGFRIFLEGIIGMNRSFFGADYECFNCSDGALIKEATPLESRDFMDEYPEFDKEIVVDNIMDRFFNTEICPDVFGYLDDIIKEDIDLVSSICEKMATHFSTPVSSVDEADSKLDDAVSMLFHSDDLVSDEKAYLLTLFSGSMLYYFSTVTRMLYMHVEDSKILTDAANEAFFHVKNFFERVREDYKVNCLKNDSMEFHEGFFVDK